jgi:hypothetical protein
MSKQLVAETAPSTTQPTQERDIHAPAGFEPAIAASKRPLTNALDLTTTGIGRSIYIYKYIIESQWLEVNGRLPRNTAKLESRQLSTFYYIRRIW